MYISLNMLEVAEIEEKKIKKLHHNKKFFMNWIKLK